jgi:hypothetical protein
MAQQFILNEIERIEKKLVRDRTKEEHHFLIIYKYDNIRDYLLSMGEFKNVPMSEVWDNKEDECWNNR